MDFNAIAETMKLSTKVEIVHPITNQGGWFIEVATRCNVRAQNAAREILDAAVKIKNPTREERDRANAEFLAALTLGWEGLTKDGAEDPFTAERCIEIYMNPKAYWVTNQVGNAVGDPTRPFNG